MTWARPRRGGRTEWALLAWAVGVSIAGAELPERWVTVRRGDVENVAGRRAAVEQVHGVFVGISRYAGNYPPLPNARTDAIDLAAALARRSGLADAEVLLDEQATVAGLEAALRRVAARSRPDDLVVFHFSGHGLGLLRENDHVLKGLLLLHDAPPVADLRRGAFDRGVIDMDWLERQCRTLGLRAKHRLVLLDTCHGGLSAYSRSPFTPTIEGTAPVEFRLRRSATYIVSAGAAEQKVLDGPPQGHGLLTGGLLGLLQGGPATERQLVTVEGIRYLPLRAVFAELERHVPTEAHRQHASRSIASRSPAAPAHELQVPQERLRGGEGHVYLPWRESTSPGPVAPAPPHAVVEDSLPTRSVAPESHSTRLREWASAAARRQNWAPQRETDFLRLTDLLERGPPGKSEQPLSIALELLVRPSSAALATAVGSSVSPPTATAAERFLAAEQLHERIGGAGWVRPEELGDVVTPTHELALAVLNFGLTPVHVYVLAIDGRGGVDLLSGGDDRSVPLASRRGRWQPAPVELRGHLWPTGWRIEGQMIGVDQALLAIACVEPWPELVAVAKRLTQQSRKPDALRSPAEPGLAGALPARFGSIDAARLLEQPWAAGFMPGGAVPIALHTTDRWVGTSWTLQVVAGELVLAETTLRD